MISGYIRFALGAAQPTTLQVADPTDAPAPVTIQAEVAQTVPTTLATTRTCFHGTAINYVQYFCAIPVLAVAAAPDPALTWEGTLRINPTTLPTLSATLADAVAANRKVCRYRAAATYVAINTPRANENLVVIQAGNGTTAFTCPTPTTWPHQPAT